MPHPLDPNDLVTLEDLPISSMWEIAALVEVLEKKGLLTKQDILEAIRELRRKNPQAKTPREFDDHPDPAFPEPSLLTETADTIINQTFDLLNGNKLTAHQVKADHTEYMVLPIPLRNSDHMGSIAMWVEQRQPLVLFCPLSQRGAGGI